MLSDRPRSSRGAGAQKKPYGPERLFEAFNELSEYPLLQSPTPATGVLISVCPVGVRLNLENLPLCNAVSKTLQEDRFCLAIDRGGSPAAAIKYLPFGNRTGGQNPVRQNLYDFDL